MDAKQRKLDLITRIDSIVSQFPLKVISTIVAEYVLFLPQFDTDTKSNQLSLTTFGITDVGKYLNRHLCVTPTKLSVKQRSEPWIFTSILPYLSANFVALIKYKEISPDCDYATIIITNGCYKSNWIARYLDQQTIPFKTNCLIFVREEKTKHVIFIIRMDTQLKPTNYRKYDIPLGRSISSYYIMIGCGYTNQEIELIEPPPFINVNSIYDNLPNLNESDYC
jgi:hypothetical protein